MSNFCPICKKSVKENATECENCGFADKIGINRQFPIPEDLENWIETVVKPYRIQWEAKKREAELLAQLEEKDKKIKELEDSVNNSKNLTKNKFNGCIAVGFCCTVGLKTDGTVVAVGLNDQGRCNVSGWCDIVAVSAGSDYTVGLKKDGTVVTVGNSNKGWWCDKCNVRDWRDIGPFTG